MKVALVVLTLTMLIMYNVLHMYMEPTKLCWELSHIRHSEVEPNAHICHSPISWNRQACLFITFIKLSVFVLYVFSFPPTCSAKCPATDVCLTTTMLPIPMKATAKSKLQI